MQKTFLISCLFVLILSGCGVSVPTQEPATKSADDFVKISMTLDVAVGSDGSISQGACFGQGTIASVLYFSHQGGNPVSQISTLTVNSVPCLDCYSEIRSSTTQFPIELSAVYSPHSVDIRDAEGNPEFMKDELRFWISSPPVNSLDIYYECGGDPATLPDYGSAVSNIAAPFVFEQWTQDLVLNEVKVSTRKDYIFPPTYKADITFSTIETLVDAIE